MHFPVACQFVGGVVEEGAQAVQETVYIPLADFSYETLDFVRRFAGTYRSVVGEQEAEKALFHFAVRESEGIVFEFGVVILDGEVAALVDDRYRVGGSRVDGIQHRAAGDDVLYLFHVVVVQLHKFH